MGPRNESLIAAAEAALGLRFPPTYRRFLKELGAGSIAGEEFYGVIDLNFTASTVPNGVWLTLTDREQFELPSQYIYVYDLGDGTGFYLDTAQRDDHDECPVVSCHGTPDAGDAPVEFEALDFGYFFYTTIREALTERPDDETLL